MTERMPFKVMFMYFDDFCKGLCSEADVKIVFSSTYGFSEKKIENILIILRRAKAETLKWDYIDAVMAR